MRPWPSASSGRPRPASTGPTRRRRTTSRTGTSGPRTGAGTASFGRWARIAGWLAVFGLLLQNVTTYYNTAQSPWIYGLAGLLVFLLVRDRFRRKNA